MAFHYRCPLLPRRQVLISDGGAIFYSSDSQTILLDNNREVGVWQNTPMIPLQKQSVFLNLRLGIVRLYLERRSALHGFNQSYKLLNIANYYLVGTDHMTLDVTHASRWSLAIDASFYLVSFVEGKAGYKFQLILCSWLLHIECTNSSVCRNRL